MVPADMYSVLAAELMIWSMACIAKLKVMNSTTGRNPAIAAPQLIPVNPAWAIVVEAQQTRLRLSHWGCVLVHVHVAWQLPHWSMKLLCI